MEQWNVKNFQMKNDKISLDFKWYKLFLRLKLMVLLTLLIKSKRKRTYDDLIMYFINHFHKNRTNLTHNNYLLALSKDLMDH